MMAWLDLHDDDDAQARRQDFWAQLTGDQRTGEFWADRIKTLRGRPAERLALALKNLPLPGAFREAAIATRALIRSKRKAGLSPADDLRLLYELAALQSFSVDYALRLQEPGFNVMETIPGGRLRDLPYSYVDLGYRHLALLNRTDIKWFIEEWGEPKSHGTLNELHRDVWDEYESRLLAQRRLERQRFQELVNRLL